MAYLLGFAGSNSSTSINYALVKYTAGLITDIPIKLMDLAQCPFPMFSEDHEREQGYSDALRELLLDIQNADGLLISVNEHNGALSAYFKNLLDWLSRLDRRCMADKRVLLMATSGGKRGPWAPWARPNSYWRALAPWLRPLFLFPCSTIILKRARASGILKWPKNTKRPWPYFSRPYQRHLRGPFILWGMEL